METLAENISVVKKSELEGSLRVDAEYYQPRYIYLLKIKNKLSNFLKAIVQPQEFTRSYTEDNKYLFLRAQNVKNGFIDLENKVFISPQNYQKVENAHIQEGDILIVRTGANAGDTATVPSYLTNVAVSSHTLRLIPKDKKLGYAIGLFFITDLGRKILQRNIYGGSRPQISKMSLLKLKVPNLETVKDEIYNIMVKYYDLFNESHVLYSQAEQLLIKQLEIEDLTLGKDLAYTTNLKDTINSNRIDAEYFRPKYKKMLSHIKKKCIICRLGDIVIIKKGIEPGSAYYQDEGIPFIRVSNLSKYELTDNNQQYLAEEFYNRLRKEYQPKIDEILLSKDATPGIALVNREEKSIIICGGILRLISKNSDINNEYLALVFNSIIVQSQIERDVGGSIINHWRPDQIKETIIPVLPKQTQDKLAHLVIEYYNPRKEAKSLLGQAKRKVEDMVERGIDAN